MKTSGKNVVKKSSNTKSKSKSAKKSSKVVVSNTTKNVKHNEKNPVEKVSRSQMATLIMNSRGRFFVSTHVDKEGNLRTMNCVKSKAPATELGYITVYSMKDKGLRNINPQTLQSLTYDGVHYKVK